ncbi:MAG: ATP-dependent Clp protease adapter ClpS [Nitrosomonadales bacterium]|nr:ATP-dependent Clp protease adapter ClpS [Nitrosomonadales bacterium]
MATKQQNSSVLAPERAKTKPPSMYKVILFNDDYTTMEFVIEVLQRFFAMDRERAMQTMLKVHNEGSAVCGVYSRDVAETKVAQVTEFAKQHGHPLRCGTEEI